MAKFHVDWEWTEPFVKAFSLYTNPDFHKFDKTPSEVSPAPNRTTTSALPQQVELRKSKFGLT